MIAEIYDRLKIWREARHITVRSQQEGYLANISMEIGEVGKEMAKSDDAGVVAELCDCLVITMNCYDGKPDFYILEYWSDCNASFRLLYPLILRDCMDYWDNLYRMEEICAVFYHIKNCITSLGYDFNKAMDETLKKIESREGYWDESQKKWIKTATNYQPDYESCRLRSEK